jgi:hypothetical protein
MSSSYSNNPSGGGGGGGDSKKEDFRKYLEKTGVLDALTKVLVGLYEEPERPNNAVDYIRKYMGAPHNVDVESIQQQNSALKKQNEHLSKQVEELKQQLNYKRSG